MTSEQRNRVHLDSSIWEPDETEQNNEGTIFLLLAVMEGMRKLNRVYTVLFSKFII